MKCRAKTYTGTLKVLNFCSMKDNFVMDIRKNGKIADSQKYNVHVLGNWYVCSHYNPTVMD